MDSERREREQRSFDETSGKFKGSMGQGAGLISLRSVVRSHFPLPEIATYLRSLVSSS